jgi:hypothetical protein
MQQRMSRTAMHCGAGDCCKSFSVISEPPGEVRDGLNVVANMQGEQTDDQTKQAAKLKLTAWQRSCAGM